MSRKLLVAAVCTLAASLAQATSYSILNTSSLSNVARIGGRNIPEIASFNCADPACMGALDPTDPLNWPILDSDMNTFPVYSGSVATGGVEGNYANVAGSIDVVAGSVTAAVMTMYNSRLSVATYQSATVQNNMVSGDSSILQPLAEQGTVGVPLNPLTWTFNPITNALEHQGQVPGGGGTNGNSNNTTACDVLPGSTGPSGQCRQLAGAINASGALGQNTTANSVWNWTGIAANYLVADNATTPWHTLTNATMTVTGAAGLPGVVWDLSGFVDGVGGVITARVYADALTSTSGSAMTALYTLRVQVVPVPAAVWMMGSALGLLGWLRRRSRAG